MIHCTRTSIVRFAAASAVLALVAFASPRAFAQSAAQDPAGAAPAAGIEKATSALAAAGIPGKVRREIEARIEKRGERFRELLSAALADAAADPWLLARVDKTKGLSKDYVPADLVHLDGTGISVSRRGHELREPAYRALLAMEHAARRDGVDLMVGSAYRSYAYQAGVFAREVRDYGRVQAERESAHPGSSQHQLGLAIDFAPIDDSFAATRASRWLREHARAFGFSLSYPKGYEAITGYRPESWHYRYIGTAAAALEGEYFGGVQQYLIEFFEAYRSR
ncbi:MAG: M15 family metallopeptidase [Treponema sp.]|nr:M15 family metallopeptidase [Treponema sp.]